MPPQTPPVRSQSYDFWASALCVCFSKADVAADLRPASDAGFLPIFVSASQRCIALCRWLV
jgi:hypothetical protein